MKATAAAAALVAALTAAPVASDSPAALGRSQGREVLRGYLMPFKCQLDEKVSHTRDCALRPECEITGYGLALDDGTFLQFDVEGNKKAVSLLKTSTKTHELKAEAEGERVGALFRVRTVQLK